MCIAHLRRSLLQLRMTSIIAKHTASAPTFGVDDDRGDALRDIERRVLWLATSIVHHANKIRPNASGVKVGGHQASSASIATIMTSLWFEQLRG